MLNRRLNIIAVVLIFILLMGMVALAVYEPFKVKLGLFDRMVCLALLPAEGTYATLKIVREMQMELAPSEEENKAAGLQPNLLTGGTEAMNGWNKVEDKEIVFGDIAKAIIVSALEKLNDANPPKLTQQHFNLYRWFVLNEEQEEFKESE